jgi:NAD(P)-dependent dehydrogenase (short-subunit alcohol dehydrogenase family)
MNTDSKAKKIALVTGANRGLGFETCRQLGKKGYTVLLTSRSKAKGKEAADKLRADGLDVRELELDVTSDESVTQAAALVKKEFGRLDVLVNNAGVLLDTDKEWDYAKASALLVPVELLKKTFETNVYGAYRMCQAFAPLLIQTAKEANALCRIVQVSSGMGQLSDMNSGYPAYRISKTALNAVTRIFSQELSKHHILVNSICPGWVKTDMGGAGAELTPEQGADTITWAATLPQDGPTGGFFRNREPIDW